ncbi:MAG: DNA polymerase I [Terriglobia bacterium]
MPPGSGEKKLFLIDALSLVFRAFYAPMQMALVSPAGLPTKAIYIFVRTLRKIIKDHCPDYIAVAFDLSAPTFRDQLFATYKAQRPPFPEDLSVQLPFVRRFCQALGLPIVEKEGFEADDVIGTLARQAEGNGLETLIVTGDEDMFQLVDPKIKVLKPSRAKEGETLCDEAKVVEIIGVEPGKVVDWVALTGDPSDNIPGARPLPGSQPESAEGKKKSYIGPKGATDLIRQFGTLENALDHWEQVSKQSYREALRDFRTEALLSKQLATIRTDVPLELGVDQLIAPGIHTAEAVELCRELGFTSLLREFLEEAPAAGSAGDSPGAGAPGIIAQDLRTPRAIEAWLCELPAQKSVAIYGALEGEEGFSGELNALELFDGERAAVIPLAAHDRHSLLAAAGPFLADSSAAKIVHNSKLLRLLLKRAQMGLEGVQDDTLLYSFLLDPLASSHGLRDAFLRLKGAALSGSPGAGASATLTLARALRPQIEREGLKDLYEQIELPLSAVLADLEFAGVRIDPAILGHMSKEFERELAELTKEIHQIAGEAFDIDSPKQLGNILFEKLKLPGGRRLKKSGQYSTDASVLEGLAAKYELPQKILNYRTRAKLKSTYVDALPESINPQTGRLHTSFNQGGARTGRLSSSNPNLQNIPVGDEFGLRIRSAFVADPGWQLISADYSQIELRVLAHMSADPVLIETFEQGEDIHARTAQEIFGVLPALQTHEHRRMAKAINYGVIYGLSSFGLAARTGSSKSEAQQYIDAYFRRYAKVQEFLDRVVDEARTTGRVRTLFGRLRPIPEINSRDVMAHNRAEREAMNTPLQGTAADLLKLAMVKAHDRLQREHLRTCMILTVHDELVFEAPDVEVETAQGIVREEMENVFPMKVPLRVEIGAGANWKDAK